MLRPLTKSAAVAGQILPGDVNALAAAGFQIIICNRPNHEDVDQPTAETMRSAAETAGLDFVHAPISGYPDEAAVAAVAQALADDRPALLYCRSGMRSTAVWALAMRRLGRGEPDDLRAAAAAAGYDLSRLPL